MTDAVDLYQARAETLDELNKAKQLNKKRGFDLAKSEQAYRVAKAQYILVLREDGTPVTIIADLVKGDPNVAKLKYERDCAEVLYKSLMEAINILKLQLRVIETDIENERRGM